MSGLDPITRNCVTVRGNTAAPRTMVHVHGFGTDQSCWSSVAAAFERDYRIVLLDNAGAGSSPPEAFNQHRYLDLEGYADDLVEICAALRVRGAVLVGHSVGGMIAAKCAVRRPELCSQLVLIGASARYLDDGDYRGGFTEQDLDATYSAVMQNYDQWVDQFAPQVMGHSDRPRLAQTFAASMKAIPAERALTVLCSIFQADHRPLLAAIDRPTLLIQAARDIAVPLAAAQYLHEHIRGSRLEVVDTEGHLPHVSAPGDVVAAMQRFLRGR